MIIPFRIKAFDGEIFRAVVQSHDFRNKTSVATAEIITTKTNVFLKELLAIIWLIMVYFLFYKK